MKNLKFLVLGLFCLFFTLNVNALDVNDLDQLKTCLDGAETSCIVKEELVLTTGSETLELNEKTVVLEKTITVKDAASLTINGEGKIEGTVTTGLINIKKGGTLVVNGGSFKNDASAAKCFGIYGSETDDLVKTTLTIKEGVKLSANYGILIGRAEKSTVSYGVVVNYAGDFEGINGNNGYNDGTIGMTTNGYIKATSGNIPVINITGGSIKTVEGTTGDLNADDAPAIYAGGYAIWNISDGILEGSEALSIKAGEFNVTGGTLKAFGTKATPEQFDNGSEATGSAISITANKEYAKAVVLNIVNVAVESENSSAIFEGKSDDTNTAISELKVISGNFSGKDDVLDVENIEGFVSGGTFNLDFDEKYLASGYVSKENEDGGYTVGIEYTVTVEDLENGKVVVDKTKAFEGEEVLVTVTPNENYVLEELVVKNGDNTVTITDNKFEMPKGNVTITATFEEVTTTTDIPVLDTEEEVEEVVVGVKDDENTVEQILLDSIKENSELSEKVKDTSINVLIDITKVDVEELPEEVKEAIEEKAGEATIAEYFDISVLIKNAKDNIEIDKLTELKEEIELMILLPEDLKNNDEKVDREYFVIREHDGQIDKIAASLSEDGKYLVFKSKNFSTYALAYEDTEKIENPSTGDNIMLYVTLGVVSIIGLTVVIKKRSFN